MLFALTYLLFFVPHGSGTSAIVSQLSKIFRLLTDTRFLNGSAKVRANLFLPNFSANYFENIF